MSKLFKINREEAKKKCGIDDEKKMTMASEMLCAKSFSFKAVTLIASLCGIESIMKFTNDMFQWNITISIILRIK